MKSTLLPMKSVMGLRLSNETSGFVHEWHHFFLQIRYISDRWTNSHTLYTKRKASRYDVSLEFQKINFQVLPLKTPLCGSHNAFPMGKKYLKLLSINVEPSIQSKPNVNELMYTTTVQYQTGRQTI